MSEEKRWTDLSSRNPYWAVLTESRFRGQQMQPADLTDFFASGERDFGRTLGLIRRWIDADFQPTVAVDYGCGVGRISLPMARVSKRVIGVDISVPMLREAESNTAKRGMQNVEFVHASAFAEAGSVDPFDFVHSYIVFQHMPPRVGLSITDTLLQRLRAGGVGALHYTYARRASSLRRIVHALRRWLPLLNFAVNVVQKRPWREPLIPMFEYPLDQLLEMLNRHGCSQLHAELTDHGGHLGAMIIFRKA